MCLRAALLRHESGAGSSKMVHQKYLPLKGSLNKHTHKSRLWDFPDSPGVKNPPASAGDMASVPGPGRFHRPRGR